MFVHMYVHMWEYTNTVEFLKELTNITLNFELNLTRNLKIISRICTVNDESSALFC